jgi:hypothetical protein
VWRSHPCACVQGMGLGCVACCLLSTVHASSWRLPARMQSTRLSRCNLVVTNTEGPHSKTNRTAADNHTAHRLSYVADARQLRSPLPPQKLHPHAQLAPHRLCHSVLHPAFKHQLLNHLNKTPDYAP